MRVFRQATGQKIVHQQSLRKPGQGKIAGDNRFDKFKNSFFKALGKLNQMQVLSQLLTKDRKGSKLSESIEESIRFIEVNAYTKLVKTLKERIRLFDTPLENQPDFLVFMKVTFKMLRNSKQGLEMYSHIINELFKARLKYIELSYQEKITLINEKKKKE
jgi:hypothetical protein